eukprot:Awhi_evm2s15745
MHHDRQKHSKRDCLSCTNCKRNKKYRCRCEKQSNPQANAALSLPSCFSATTTPVEVLADWIEGDEVPQFTAYATEKRALMATPPESVTLHGDSGCSITLVNNTWILEHVTKVSQPITLADGSTIISTYCGQLKPISFMAYYVPNLVANLLSLSQMTEWMRGIVRQPRGRHHT